MDNYIKIKCPFCGAVLKVKQQPGLDKASITCPVCKNKSSFTASKAALDGATSATMVDGDKTQLPGAPYNFGMDAEKTLYTAGNKSHFNNEETTTAKPINISIGALVEKSGKRWPLHPGVNTIGRKLQSDPQQVDVPISDYTGARRMSRNHAKIEVIRLANGSAKHILYNWQNKNSTFVGGDPLEADDRIVLNNGTVLKFANVDVKFVIDDSEATTI